MDRCLDYRGPGLDGHAPAGAALPLTWSEEQNIAWKTPIDGRGWSSPVVADGRIWLNAAEGSATPRPSAGRVMEMGFKPGDRVRIVTADAEYTGHALQSR